MKKLKHRLAEVLREAAFRLDGRPLLKPEDVEQCLNAHFGMQGIEQTLMHAHAVRSMQKQAGDIGFWVPQRSSGAIN